MEITDFKRAREVIFYSMLLGIRDRKLFIMIICKPTGEFAFIIYLFVALKLLFVTS
jgi:hypothetical protein